MLTEHDTQLVSSETEQMNPLTIGKIIVIFLISVMTVFSYLVMYFVCIAGDLLCNPDSGYQRNQDILIEDHDVDVFCCPDAGVLSFGVHQTTPAITQHNKLYEGASISVGESVYSILSFAQSENLSGAALEKLLKLIDVHLPKPNNHVQTTHLFYGQIENADFKYNLVYYCSVCWGLRASKTDLCTECILPTRKVEYFVSLPLAPQISKLYSKPGFLDKIKYKHNRSKKCKDNFEDIYDGDVYKYHSAVLSNHHNISLMWYTDGVQMYECSTYSLWPFFFVVNELPPSERFKKENLIMAGFWGSSEKPHPNVFLKNTTADLLELKTGIEVNPHGMESKIKVQVILLCGTCDAPAKAAFLHMKTHAGYFSCPKCLTEGQYNDAMTFPHEDNLHLRTCENYIQHLGQAKTIKEPYGIKGETILSEMLAHPNLFECTAIDSMHCIYSGITKQLLNLWFNPVYSEKPFSLYEHLETVNAILAALRLPHFVQRSPLPVNKLAYFKASLFRNIFFYVLVPLLQDFMTPEYFENLADLVNGTSLLNSDSVSNDDIDVADKLLKRFSCNFQNLYGARHMSSNVHLLRHLAANVRALGPLWVTSCFPFEDLNGKLVNLAHGTRHAGLQIAKNLSTFSLLDKKIDELPEGRVKLLCQQLTQKSNRIFITESVNGVHVVGYLDVKPKVYNDSISCQISQIYVSPCKFSTFSRLYKDKTLYVSSSYERGSKVSSIVNYEENRICKFGQLLCFVKVESPFGPPELLTYLRPAQVVRFSEHGTKHMFSIAGFSEPELVSVLDLKSVCFMINVHDKHTISVPLNRHEME